MFNSLYGNKALNIEKVNFKPTSTSVQIPSPAYLFINTQIIIFEMVSTGKIFKSQCSS